MDIFFYNTPIYRKMLLQFLQFTEKYYVNRTPFHFRRRAEAVLRRAARLSKAPNTARPSTPKKWFYTSIWAVLYEEDLACLSTVWRSKIDLSKVSINPANILLAMFFDLFKIHPTEIKANEN